jgi:hypothetical protein
MKTVVKNTMSQSLARIEQKLKNVPKKALEIWLDNTPKRSGDAKKKTKLKGDTIHANYPYAKRLDEGWSKQAPNGISEPTEKALDEHLDKIIRK